MEEDLQTYKPKKIIPVEILELINICKTALRTRSDWLNEERNHSRINTKL